MSVPESKTPNSPECPYGCGWKTADANTRMWSMRIGRHITSKHRQQGLGQKGSAKVVKKIAADVSDALVKSWRGMRKQLATVDGLIEKMQSQIDELANALAESQREVRKLDKDNADLRGKLLNARQSTQIARKQSTYVPLEKRLKPEELAYLEQMKKGGAQ